MMQDGSLQLMEDGGLSLAEQSQMQSIVNESLLETGDTSGEEQNQTMVAADEMTEADRLLVADIFTALGREHGVGETAWPGVTVVNGHITELKLRVEIGVPMIGNVSSALSGLSTLWSISQLMILDLAHNGLLGTIPLEVAQLSNLQKLSLASNKLSGSLPSELGNLSQLEQLYLHTNELVGTIPLELGQLSKLKGLILCCNQLSGSLPSELGNLSHLEKLHLYSNQLAGPIPADLGNLKNLRELDISENKLTGPVPLELGQLSKLKELNLSRNNFSGALPSELGNLSELEKLYLHHNLLAGSLPAELGNLKNLRQLSISENKLTGSLPAELGNLSQLEALHLHTNELPGTIPIELGQLSKLKELILCCNQLSGSVPSELGNLSQLEELHLHTNQLAGPIPADLGNLKNLRELNISYNKLTGSLPSELGKLRLLEKLSFHSNELVGTISLELGQLSKLKELNLYCNQFSGSLPSELGHLSQLEKLYLYSNQLTGSLPADLGNLKNLRQVYMSRNKLTGPIPRELGSWVNLEELDLANNELSGPLPSEFGNLQKLIRLQISQNQLSVFSEGAAIGLCRDGLDVYTSRNPWESPPSEVVDGGLESIVAWYRDVALSGISTSSKVKVVFVGLGMAGKTSIVRRLLEASEEELPQENERTIGIDRRKTLPLLVPQDVIIPKADGSRLENVALTVWDFAGQKEYYSYHQLFLTKGALFVLVVDLFLFSKGSSTVEQNDAAYQWLDALNARVPGSAVLVIGSKTDLFSDANEAASALAHLRECIERWQKNKDEVCKGIPTWTPLVIGDYIAVSCATGPSIAKCQEAVRSAVVRIALTSGLCPSACLKIPSSWNRSMSMLLALSSGADPLSAAENPGEANKLAKVAIPAPFMTWTAMMNMWKDIAQGAAWKATLGEDMEDVLLRAAGVLEYQGMVLMTNGGTLLHLDPKWLMSLLKPIADHREGVDGSWCGLDESEIVRICNESGKAGDGKVFEFNVLSQQKQDLTLRGRLGMQYLSFLWRDLHLSAEMQLLMVETMISNGTLYAPRTGDGRAAPEFVFVPAHLQDVPNISKIETHISTTGFTLKMRFSPKGSYTPPGLLPQVMAELSRAGGMNVDLLECWRFGVCIAWKESIVLVKLIEEVGRSHLDVAVTGSANAVVAKNEVKKCVCDVFTMFPGLNVPAANEERINNSGKEWQVLWELVNTSVSVIKEVKMQLDVIEGHLVDLNSLARKSLRGIMAVRQKEELPFPSLIVLLPENTANQQQELREPRLSSNNNDTRWRLMRLQEWGWTANKAARELFCKRMRLHFLCGHDLSIVPTGPKGEGYLIEEPRQWVEQVAPLLVASLFVLKVAAKVAGGIELPVDNIIGVLCSLGLNELQDSIPTLKEEAESWTSNSMQEDSRGAGHEGQQRLRGKAYDDMCRLLEKMSVRREDIEAIMNLRQDSDDVLVWVSKANTSAFDRQAASPRPSSADVHVSPTYISNSSRAPSISDAYASPRLSSHVIPYTNTANEIPSTNNEELNVSRASMHEIKLVGSAAGVSKLSQVHPIGAGDMEGGSMHTIASSEPQGETQEEREMIIWLRSLGFGDGDSKKYARKMCNSALGINTPKIFQQAARSDINALIKEINMPAVHAKMLMGAKGNGCTAF